MTMRYAHLSDQHISDRMAQLESAFGLVSMASKPSGIAPLIAPLVLESAKNVLKLPIHDGQLAQR